MTQTPSTTVSARIFNSQIAVFLAINFGFSWALAIVIWKTGGLAGAFGLPLTALYMFGPTIGALVCTYLYDRPRWKQALGFTSFPKWVWLGGVGVAAIIVAGATLISLIGENVHWIGFREGFTQAYTAAGVDLDKLTISMDQMVWLQLLVNVPLGLAINGVVLLSEELGWRGWLYDRWRHLGFWRGSLTIGFVWGVWHAPIIAMGHNYPGQPISGIFLMIVFCMLLAPIVGWLREVGHSIFAASIFHGSINGLAGIGLIVVSSSDMPWRGVAGIGGFVMLASICGVLYVLFKPKMGAQR